MALHLNGVSKLAARPGSETLLLTGDVFHFIVTLLQISTDLIFLSFFFPFSSSSSSAGSKTQ